MYHPGRSPRRVAAVSVWRRQKYPARDGWGWAGFQLGWDGAGDLGLPLYTHAHATQGLAGFLFGRWTRFVFLFVGYPRLADLDERCWFLDTRLFNTRTNAYLPTSPSIYLLASCACALSAGWGVSCVCVWARGWLWGGLVGGWGWEGRSIPPGGWRRRRCICEGACSLSLLSLNLPSLIFAALDICLVSLLLSRGWWGGSSRLHLWCWLWLGWGWLDQVDM